MSPKLPDQFVDQFLHMFCYASDDSDDDDDRLYDLLDSFSTVCLCICEGAVMSTVVRAGYLLFKEYCESIAEEPVPQMSFYDEVSRSYS